MRHVVINHIFTETVLDITHYNVFEIYVFETAVLSLMDQGLNCKLNGRHDYS